MQTNMGIIEWQLRLRLYKGFYGSLAAEWGMGEWIPLILRVSTPETLNLNPKTLNCLELEPYSLPPNPEPLASLERPEFHLQSCFFSSSWKLYSKTRALNLLAVCRE